MTRRQPPYHIAFPWWIVWHDPRIEAATSVVHHAVITLAVRYWALGCQPLPDRVTDLAMVSRVPTQHFIRQETAIRAAFEAIRPALDTEHADKLEIILKRREMGRKGTAAINAKSRMKKAAIESNSTFSPPKKHAGEVEAVITTRTAPVVGRKPAMPSGTKLFRG